MRILLVFSAMFGLIGLILDAYGAHGLPLASAKDMAIWQSAVRYELLHALLLSILAILIHIRRSKWIWVSATTTVVGILMFCGGIYLRVVFQNPAFSSIVPYGGSSLMIGWLALIPYAILSPSQPNASL